MNYIFFSFEIILEWEHAYANRLLQKTNNLI